MANDGDENLAANPGDHVARRRRGQNVAIALLSVLLVAGIATVVVLLTQRDDDVASSSTAGTSTSTSGAPTTVTTAAAATAPPASPTPDPATQPVNPPPPAPVAQRIDTEPAGLFCRDLKARGYTFNESVRYWFSHGQPDQMDADKNGVPCETVFPVEAVAAGNCPSETAIWDVLEANDPALWDRKYWALNDIRCEVGWVTVYASPHSDGESPLLVFGLSAKGWYLMGQDVDVDICLRYGMPARQADRLCYR